MNTPTVARPQRWQAEPGCNRGWRGRQHRRRSRRTVLLWLLAPTALVLVGLVAFPFVATIAGSFTRWNLSQLTHPVFDGLTNFRQLFSFAGGQGALLRTVYLTGLAVPVEAVLGVCIALLLWHSGWFARVMRTAMLLPFAMTPVAVALIWALMLNPSLGIIDILIRDLGGPTVNWTANTALVIPTLALLDVWSWTPFIALLCVAGLQSVPQELIDSSRVDGCSEWRTVWHVLLPKVSSVLLAAITLRLIDSLQTFDTVYVLTSGGPGTASVTLNFLGYDDLFNAYNIGGAAAVSVLLLVTIIVLVGLLQLIGRHLLKAAV